MEKQTTSSNEINLNMLPTELWLHILSFLPHSTILFITRQVCHRFKSLSFDPYLWTHIDCNEWKECTTMSYLSIKKNTMFPSEDNTVLQNLAQKLCKEGGLKSEDLFSPILSRVAESVHSLRISKCDKDFLLGKSELASMLKCCNLTYLDLAFCWKVTNSVLNEICQGCPRIKALILSGCSNLSNGGMESVSKLPELIKLDISYCSEITDSGINYISQMPCQILHFLANGVQHASDSAIVDLVSSQTKIKTLVLDGKSLSDVSIVKICHILLDLKTFQMTDCSGLTDRSCDSLCGKIRLEELHLRMFYSQITTCGITQMFQQEQPIQLRRLSIANCKAMKDETVKTLSLKCPLLEQITLSECCEITDAGVEELVQNCRNLRRITLVGLEKLIGVWLKDMDKYLAHLVFLNLSLCNKILTDDLYSLVQRLPTLVAYVDNRKKVDLLTVSQLGQKEKLSLKKPTQRLEEHTGSGGRTVNF